MQKNPVNQARREGPSSYDAPPTYYQIYDTPNQEYLPQQPVYIPPPQLSYQQSYPPQQRAYAQIPAQPDASAGLKAQKKSFYSSGCVQGCVMTLFFGLLSFICLPSQQSQSGKLGYAKGMGIWTLITGAIVSVVAVTGIKGAQFCSYYYINAFDNGDYCETYQDWVWGVAFGTGLMFFFAGIYMTHSASKKFSQLVQNPAALA